MKKFFYPLLFIILSVFLSCAVIPPPSGKNRAIIALSHETFKIHNIKTLSSLDQAGSSPLTASSFDKNPSSAYVYFLLTYRIRNMETKRKYTLSITHYKGIKPVFNIPAGIYQVVGMEYTYVVNTRAFGIRQKHEIIHQDPIPGDLGQQGFEVKANTVTVLGCGKYGGIRENLREGEMEQVRSYFREQKIAEKWPDLEYLPLKRRKG
jgi:hypothetical protein